MAQIKGKQLKDASIKASKLEGVAASVTANKLLLTAANQTLEALNIGGDLTAAVSATVLEFSVQSGALTIAHIDSNTIIDSADAISVSNNNDETIPTTKAVKDYVDSQIGSSSDSLAIAGDSGTDTVVVGTDTLTFDGGTNLTTSVTNNQVSTALNSHIDITSFSLSGDGTIDGALTVTGALTVAGTVTTIDSTVVEVADAQLRLGANTASEADLRTAAAGLIFGSQTFSGTTEISFKLDAQSDFASTQSLDLASGKVYKINNVEVMSSTGAALVQSSVVGNGLTYSGSNNKIESNGLSVIHHDVNASISAGAIITDANGDITAPARMDSLKLEVNGISYRQGIATSGNEKDWYIDSNNKIVWHGDFNLDNTDILTLSYHAQ